MRQEKNKDAALLKNQRTFTGGVLSAKSILLGILSTINSWTTRKTPSLLLKEGTSLPGGRDFRRSVLVNNTLISGRLLPDSVYLSLWTSE